MGFLDIFKSERKNRQVYGMSEQNAIKVLILSYLLVRIQTPKEKNKLLGLFSKYNRGENVITVIGGYNPTAPNIGSIGITQTYSRVINISSEDLSGTGTIEEQIAEYINNNNLSKADDDAEVWINLT